MKFSLRQLEVFVAVARTESVTRAARELGMSASAVSGSLADLEHQFDVQLFERVAKRLRLSGLGRSLRARAEAVLVQASELEQALGRQSEVGRLRVGATLTIGNYVAPSLMARFMRDNPGSRVELFVANTAEIERRVQNFELDVGLVEGELTNPELSLTPWCDDELVVFVAPNHPLSRRASLGDEDLRAARWIVRERGSGTRQAFERAMGGILSELTLELELQHTEAIRSAVEAGLGVGCVSRIAVDDAFRHGTLVPCRVDGRDFRRQFYFVLHAQKHESVGIEAWLRLCRANPPVAPARPSARGRARQRRKLTVE